MCFMNYRTEEQILKDFDEFLKKVEDGKWDGIDAFHILDPTKRSGKEDIDKIIIDLEADRVHWAEGEITESKFISNLRKARDQIAHFS